MRLALAAAQREDQAIVCVDLSTLLGKEVVLHLSTLKEAGDHSDGHTNRNSATRFRNDIVVLRSKSDCHKRNYLSSETVSGTLIKPVAIDKLEESKN